MHRTSSPESVHSFQRARTPRQWLYALWKFSRPHTIIGTSLSVLGVYLVARSYGGAGAGCVLRRTAAHRAVENYIRVSCRTPSVPFAA